MTETYSLGATGARADSEFRVATLQVGDSAGLAGSQAAAMRNGTPVLCKGPDGAQRYYKLDAERSFDGKLVLLPL